MYETWQMGGPLVIFAVVAAVLNVVVLVPSLVLNHSVRLVSVEHRSLGKALVVTVLAWVLFFLVEVAVAITAGISGALEVGQPLVNLAMEHFTTTGLVLMTAQLLAFAWLIYMVFDLTFGRAILAAVVDVLLWVAILAVVVGLGLLVTRG